MNIEKIVKTKNDYNLAFTIFSPEQSKTNGKVVLIAPARPVCKKSFMLDFKEYKEHNFFDIGTTDLTFIHFSDDNYAPFKASQKLFSFYSKSDGEFKHFNPKELRFKSIGHFGFFKRNNEKLWSLITKDLEKF